MQQKFDFVTCSSSLKSCMLAGSQKDSFSCKRCEEAFLGRYCLLSAESAGSRRETHGRRPVAASMWRCMRPLAQTRCAEGEATVAQQEILRNNRSVAGKLSCLHSGLDIRPLAVVG